MTDVADPIAKCPRCGILFAVAAHADVTDELAHIAKLAGAVDFAREVDCPECGNLVNVRPGEAVEVGDDDVVEREIRVVGADGTRTLSRVRLTAADWRHLTNG